MFRRSLASALAPALALSLLAPAPGVSAAGLEAVGTGFELDGEAYRAVGVNYYDAFLRTLRQTRDFGATRTTLRNPDNTNTSYLDGLDGLEAAGVPFFRFNAGGFFARDYELYRTDRVAYLGQLRDVVDAAGERGIGVIPSVFWNPDEFARVVGEDRSAWADAGSATRGLADAYARDVVNTLEGADNVLMWEFGNEFNLQQDLVRGGQADITSDGVRAAVNAFAGIVAEEDAMGRATTTGHSISRPGAASLRETPGAFSRDTRAEFRGVTADDHAGLDVISAHAYQHSALGLSVEGNADQDAIRFNEPNLLYAEVLEELVRAAEAADKPVFLGEFGVRDGSAFGDPDAPASEAAQLAYLLDAVVAEGVPLSALWVYDRLNDNSGYTITADNDRAYQLDLIAEANRRLAVPEPAGLALLSLGGLLLRRRRR